MSSDWILSLGVNVTVADPSDFKGRGMLVEEDRSTVVKESNRDSKSKNQIRFHNHPLDSLCDC